MHNHKYALTVEETCKALGNISRPTYYKLVTTDQLKTFKIGSRRLTTPDAIRDCIKKREKAGG